MKKFQSWPVEQKARGHWREVLWNLAEELRPALKRAPKHGPCPFHGGKDGFRFFDDYEETGGAICNTCGAFPTGLRLLEHTLELPQHQLNSILSVTLTSLDVDICDAADLDATPSFNQGKLDRLQSVWDACVPLNHALAMPARRYFENRGLSAISSDLPKLFFHPDLPYWDNGTVLGTFPCLIAPMEVEEGIATLHRTYLTLEGTKAPVEAPKKLMPPEQKGSTIGAAVRLYEPGPVLHVAEGIETALAVRVAVREPVWAALSAGGLSLMRIPDIVGEVHIWADKDRSGIGQKAANGLASRLCSQCRVAVHIPEMTIPAGDKNVDWLDVLNASVVET